MSHTPHAPAVADAVTLQNYIDGCWTSAVAVETLADRDPATGELLAHVPLSGAADVDAAVRAARRAQPAWRRTSPQNRARALFALRELLVAHRDELARGIESVEAACAAPHLMKGQNLEGVATGVDVELVRQPVGVVAAITPFNFPIMIPLWFLPYALAAGNAFVLKPSEQDPLVSRRLFELISTIEELPPGVCNLVHGGRDAVNAILEHPEIDAVSFVGSAATARHVAATAAAPRTRS
jgi:malonate-semialdehyde dehydrogenase (acetylating)/methylmalonate-semialdehyde dehydrogenase